MHANHGQAPVKGIFVRSVSLLKVTTALQFGKLLYTSEYHMRARNESLQMISVAEKCWRESLNPRQFNRVLNSNDRVLDLVLSNFDSEIEVLHDILAPLVEHSHHSALDITVPNAKPSKVRCSHAIRNRQNKRSVGGSSAIVEPERRANLLDAHSAIFYVVICRKSRSESGPAERYLTGYEFIGRF
ncbi:hypothetical protein Trydic_g12823 [Trypoxylus dichotomus]